MSEIEVRATALGTPLMQILNSDAITPGSDASYSLCKLIYLYHPLGRKIAEGPIALAQTQSRKISIEDAPDESVVKAFNDAWAKANVDGAILNLVRTARTYGIATCNFMAMQNGEEIAADQPLDLQKIADYEAISFNILDPLNTAGSNVLNQDPTAFDFQKPVQQTAMGTATYHRSRSLIVQNEDPIYLAYTPSTFGYTGRSAYQRALYPMKSYLSTMVADDMVARKVGLLIAKMKQAGSIVDRFMQVASGVKRSLLKEAETGQVLSIEVDEDIESLNMQNVDGAGTFARTNILKNIATAADMPAIMLENETMVSGFGEGTEDSKRIAAFVDGERKKLASVYAWFDRIIMRRAWTPSYLEGLKQEFPDTFGQLTITQMFALFEKGFSAEWPEFLKEPESEKIKVEDSKLKAVIALLEVLLPKLDPENASRIIKWAQDNFNELTQLFPQALVLDGEALRDYLEEQLSQMNAGGMGGAPGEEGGEPSGMPKPPQPFANAA